MLKRSTAKMQAIQPKAVQTVSLMQMFVCSVEHTPNPTLECTFSEISQFETEMFHVKLNNGITWRSLKDFNIGNHMHSWFHVSSHKVAGSTEGGVPPPPTVDFL